MTINSALTGDTMAHAPDGFPAGLRDRLIALFTMGEAFAPWQLAANALQGIFHSAVDLLLYGAFSCPTISHFNPQNKLNNAACPSVLI